MNTIQSPDMGSTPINSEEYGYVYCITSLSYTDRCKVGCVWKEGRTPTDRLKEANASTWCMPDFKLEFAKKVKNPREKEGQLHKLLEKYSSRIHPSREFFRISPNEVRELFNLMDGEYWTDATTTEDIDNIVNGEQLPTGRDMTKRFKDGQQIRHSINDNVWVANYEMISNSILYNNTSYRSLSAFALAHYKVCRPERKTVNGWAECEYEIDGKWMSTINL